jgi:C1A family cysteine protease
MLVTPEYTEYLKKHVSWEVVDYEDNVFRGWTVDEAKMLLGDEDKPLLVQGEAPQDGPLPSTIDWKGANCIHDIHNQGNCGSCWAFATSSVVSDLCCLKKEDKGWLAPQELVYCDKDNDNEGCDGGLAANALKYVRDNGLVPEECLPYVARDGSCPNACKNGKNWKEEHVCKAKKLIDCGELKNMIGCLKEGPITVRMIVYNDFFNYKGGLYCWDGRSGQAGGHAIRCVGHSNEPEPHFTCANSWGANWGEKGYFRIKSKNGCGIRLTPHDAWSVDF